MCPSHPRLCVQPQLRAEWAPLSLRVPPVVPALLCLPKGPLVSLPSIPPRGFMGLMDTVSGGRQDPGRMWKTFLVLFRQTRTKTAGQEKRLTGLEPASEGEAPVSSYKIA